MAYEARRAAETIAYLLLKNGKRSMDKLKLIKLVYLADRESLRRIGHPIQSEARCSLPHGPVNSLTLDCLNGKFPSASDATGWAEILTPPDGHKVGLADKTITPDDLGELSRSDMEVLDSIWGKFGKMSSTDLVDWTHDPKNVPEWEDPGRSSKPITLLSILKAVDFENPEEHLEFLQECEAIDDIFVRAGF